MYFTYSLKLRSYPVIDFVHCNSIRKKKESTTSIFHREILFQFSVTNQKLVKQIKIEMIPKLGQ